MFAAVPLAILVSRLPISLDGIGVYEGIFIAIMALGGVQPGRRAGRVAGGRALQIVVWFPWWLMLAARTGVRPPIEPVAPAAESYPASEHRHERTQLRVTSQSPAALRKPVTRGPAASLCDDFGKHAAPRAHVRTGAGRACGAGIALRSMEPAPAQSAAHPVRPALRDPGFFHARCCGASRSRATRRIGPGLYIGHFGGITVSSAAIIGRDCNLSQNITIGVSGAGSKRGAPTIGDNVYIAPGARLVGKISIGNNVKIGANAVIHKDLPDNAIAVLDPGFKIISYAGNRPADRRRRDALKDKAPGRSHQPGAAPP